MSSIWQIDCISFSRRFELLRVRTENFHAARYWQWQPATSLHRIQQPIKVEYSPIHVHLIQKFDSLEF
jgi:hypothetical protein